MITSTDVTVQNMSFSQGLFLSSSDKWQSLITMSGKGGRREGVSCGASISLKFFLWMNSQTNFFFWLAVLKELVMSRTTYLNPFQSWIL